MILLAHLRKNVLYYIGLVLFIAGALLVFLPFFYDKGIDGTLYIPFFKIIFGGSVKLVSNNITYQYNFSPNVYLIVSYLLYIPLIIFAFISRTGKRNLPIFIISLVLLTFVTVFITLSIFIFSKNIPLDINALKATPIFIIYNALMLLGLIMFLLAKIFVKRY